MKRKLTLIMLAAAIIIGAAALDAKTTKKISSIKTNTSQLKKSKSADKKGYRIENGKIIPTGGKPVVVDFYDDWCGPCKQYKPIFESVERNYGSKAIFIRINTDENPEVAAYYNISAIPTTLFISANGGSTDQLIGFADAATLESFILRNL